MQVSALGEGRAVIGFAFSTVDITPSHRWREVLIDTGMALARTISVDRVLHEVAQQLRRAMACDAVAIALADDETPTLTLVHHAGFADDARRRHRTAHARAGAMHCRRGQVVTRAVGRQASRSPRR